MQVLLIEEILCVLVEHLDPWSAISLSSTSRKLCSVMDEWIISIDCVRHCQFILDEMKHWQHKIYNLCEQMGSAGYIEKSPPHEEKLIPSSLEPSWERLNNLKMRTEYSLTAYNSQRKQIELIIRKYPILGNSLVRLQFEGAKKYADYVIVIWGSRRKKCYIDTTKRPVLRSTNHEERWDELCKSLNSPDTVHQAIALIVWWGL